MSQVQQEPLGQVLNGLVPDLHFGCQTLHLSVIFFDFFHISLLQWGELRRTLVQRLAESFIFESLQLEVGLGIAEEAFQLHDLVFGWLAFRKVMEAIEGYFFDGVETSTVDFDSKYDLVEGCKTGYLEGRNFIKKFANDLFHWYYNWIVAQSYSKCEYNIK